MGTRFKLALSAGLSGMILATAIGMSRGMDSSSALGIAFWFFIAVAVVASWVAVASVD